MKKRKNRPTRQNGREIFIIALAAIALGIVNLVLKRYIDGSFSMMAGMGALVVWAIKRRS